MFYLLIKLYLLLNWSIVSLMMVPNCGIVYLMRFVSYPLFQSSGTSLKLTCSVKLTLPNLAYLSGCFSGYDFFFLQAFDFRILFFCFLFWQHCALEFAYAKIKRVIKGLRLDQICVSLYIQGWYEIWWKSERIGINTRKIIM